jgi:hypothetical protein
MEQPLMSWWIFVCFQKGPILEWAVFYTKPDILFPLWVFRCLNIKISILMIKIVKNEVNSPYIVYLSFGELISTKRGHYRFLQDIQDLQTLQIL